MAKTAKALLDEARGDLFHFRTEPGAVYGDGYRARKEVDLLEAFINAILNEREAKNKRRP